MNNSEGSPYCLNMALLIIVGFLVFDALFKALNAQEVNAIVRFVSSVAGTFLTPFEGMFANQHDLLTSAIAILGYLVLAAILLAGLRSLQNPRRTGITEGAADPEVDDQTQQL
jgi:hypothetical protein